MFLDNNQHACTHHKVYLVSVAHVLEREALVEPTDVLHSNRVQYPSSGGVQYVPLLGLVISH